jgi:hypothetical protein
MTVDYSELTSGFQAAPTAPISQGCLYLGSQSEVVLDS